jgi:hypothetical protein
MEPATQKIVLALFNHNRKPRFEMAKLYQVKRIVIVYGQMVSIIGSVVSLRLPSAPVHTALTL